MMMRELRKPSAETPSSSATRYGSEFGGVEVIVKLKEEREFWCCDIIAGSPITGPGVNEQGAEPENKDQVGPNG